LLLRDIEKVVCRLNAVWQSEIVSGFRVSLLAQTSESPHWTRAPNRVRTRATTGIAVRHSDQSTTKEFIMSVARVTEITATSKKSFEDAVKVGIDRACKTLKNVEGAWIQDQKVVISKGKIAGYRVSMKVTFILAE
jgi:dodecin